MYESPITIISDTLIDDIVQKQNEYIVKIINRLGFNVNEEEIKKALTYDRNQWERGYAAGKMDGYNKRDAEIVRCRDCVHKEKEQPGMIFCPLMVGSWVDEDHFCKWGDREKYE